MKNPDIKSRYMEAELANPKTFIFCFIRLTTFTYLLTI